MKTPLALFLVASLGMMIVSEAQNLADSATFVWDASSDLNGNDMWETVDDELVFWTLEGNALPSSGDTELPQAPAWFSAPSGTTLSFEEIQNGTDLNVSWEIAFRPGDFDGNYVLFETGGNGDGTAFVLENDLLEFRVQDANADDNRVIVSHQFAAGDESKFHYVVATVLLGDGDSEVVLYVNGAEAGRGEAFGALLDWAGTDDSGLGRLVGAVSTGQTGFDTFMGDIAFLRYHEDTVLAADAIADEFTFLQSGSTDSDEDGLADFWEQQSFGNLDQTADGDGDGDTLTNIQELQNGSDPTEADSDSDGLNDNIENGSGTWVDATNTGTSPRNADTDGDGLNDNVETNTGQFVDASNTGTDPHSLDTDGDLRSDGSEVDNGTDPTDPGDPASNGGLEGWWTFDEGAGTTAADSSTEGRDATFRNGAPQWIEGKDGGGLAFEGAEDLIVEGYKGTSGNRPRSIAFWIKTDWAVDASSGIVGWGTTGTGQKWHTRLNNTAGNGVVGAIRTEIEGSFIVGTTPINDGEWHYVVSVFPDGGTFMQDVKMYVDGELEEVSGTGSATVEVNTADEAGGGTDVTIGSRLQGANDQFMFGELDDVSVWSRELMEDEVAALFNGATPLQIASTLTDGLSGYWPFDDAAGTTAADLSGNGRSAEVLSGEPVWIEGKFGGALDFDGASSMQVPDYYGIGGKGPRTIAMWIKADSPVVGGATGLMGWGTADTGAKWHFKVEGSNQGLRTENSGGNKWGDIPLTDGEWHHIVGVFPDGGEVIGDVLHYVDGVFDEGENGGLGQEVNTENDPDNGAVTVSIGSAFQGVTERFTVVMIDEVAIWERALTPAEIGQLFAQPLSSVLAGFDPDPDDDGLPTAWEELFELDPSDPADASLDGDQDTLDNLTEFENGTDPTKADSDDDGADDAAELAAGTDPNEPDSDGDGIADGAELASGTNPLDPDSDGDSVSDKWEIDNGTNPLDPNSPAAVVLEDLGEPDESWTTLETLPSFHDYEGGLDTADVTFCASIDFDAKEGPDREVIFETGGGTVGFSLVYEEGNKLVLRASGSGGFVLVVAEATLSAEQIAAGDLQVLWAFDVDPDGPQTISLWVDSFPVAQASGDLDMDWTGTDGASFGTGTTSFAGTGSNTTLSGVDFTSGTINLEKGLGIYTEQLPVIASIDLGGGLGFAITNAVYDGTNVTLTWRSRAGVSYVLQASADLGVWFEVEDSIPSEGTETTYTDIPGAETDVLYYRVIGP